MHQRVVAKIPCCCGFKWFTAEKNKIISTFCLLNFLLNKESKTCSYPVSILMFMCKEIYPCISGIVINYDKVIFFPSRLNILVDPNKL